MYIDTVPNRSSPPAILIRESYRVSGKVKKRTIANISKCPPEVIEALRVLLRGGSVSSVPLEELFEVSRSLHHGHVAAVLGTMRQIGLHNMIGRRCRERDLALALVAGRIVEPCSKLALSRHLDPATATSTLGRELGLGAVDESDLYASMRWLFERRRRIETRLAADRLEENHAVLYDLSSIWYEGSKCSLAQFGHNRDGKKGKRQINFGLLCDGEGCPVSVQVYPGSTADPATVGDQLRSLRRRFKLKRVIIVGDRGMLTSARIDYIKGGEKTDEDEPACGAAAADNSTTETDSDDLDAYGWISALRGDQIRKLVTEGDFQPELFDERDMAEIQSEEHYPGERLVVCRNRALGLERARKRTQLLKATETKLGIIRDATRRERNPYPGKRRGGASRIGRRVERECAGYKVLKHFELTITDTGLDFKRSQQSIDQEAALDGFYIVRAGRVSPDQMDASKLVETYKSLSKVERDFRAIKTTALKVRPIFHRDEDMVRAHIFICMLACHLRWHMEKRLQPALFNDEEPGGKPRETPVSKAERSESAEEKAATKMAKDGLPVHSFDTLLEDLSTLCRNTIQPTGAGTGEGFYKLTEPTPVQAKALDLLGVTLKSEPHM